MLVRIWSCDHATFCVDTLMYKMSLIDLPFSFPIRSYEMIIIMFLLPYLLVVCS